MKNLFRKNHWSSEDKMLAAAGVVGAVGIIAVVMQRKAAAAAAPTAGLRGLGAYFIDPVNTPISGLGHNYVSVR